MDVAILVSQTCLEPACMIVLSVMCTQTCVTSEGNQEVPGGTACMRTLGSHLGVERKHVAVFWFRAIGYSGALSECFGTDEQKNTEYAGQYVCSNILDMRFEGGQQKGRQLCGCMACKISDCR